MRMTNPNMPRQPVATKPRRGATPMTPKPFGGPITLATPGKPPGPKMAMGGMATKKIANPNIASQPRQPVATKPRPGATPSTPKPFGSLPRNPNLPTPKPGPQMAMKHGGMAHGTKAKKGRGMAIMIAIGKPKGRGKS